MQWEVSGSDLRVKVSYGKILSHELLLMVHPPPLECVCLLPMSRLALYNRNQHIHIKDRSFYAKYFKF